jgi:hypothetical protein
VGGKEFKERGERSDLIVLLPWRSCSLRTRFMKRLSSRIPEALETIKYTQMNPRRRIF